jgi:hypothetical protein
MSGILDNLLSDTHNLYTTGHIFDPFLAYFVFGYPFLALAIAGIWEIGEYLVFYMFGNYSPIFLNEELSEPIWDIIILDIGGTLIGTLLAANLSYYFYRQFTPPNSPWTSTVSVLFWFIFRAILTMTPSGFGWECNKTLDLCTSTGYHLFPWGVIPILIINGIFIWYYFPETKYWLLTGLVVITLPTLQRSLPGSFIQIIILGPIAIVVFIICWVLKCIYPSYTRINRVDIPQ